MVARKSNYKRPHGGFGDPNGADYSADEEEFMKAIDAFKLHSRHQFPTCCEVLAVIHSLGYRKAVPPTIVVRE